MLGVTGDYRASYDFSDPTEESTLELKRGDAIEVTEADGDNWWYGRNLRTGKEGYFPPKFVSKVEKEKPKPKPKKKRNKGQKGQGAMQAEISAMLRGGKRRKGGDMAADLAGMGPPPPPAAALSSPGSSVRGSSRQKKRGGLRNRQNNDRQYEQQREQYTDPYANDMSDNSDDDQETLPPAGGRGSRMWKGFSPTADQTNTMRTAQRLGEGGGDYTTYDMAAGDTSMEREVQLTNPMEEMNTPLLNKSKRIKGQDIFVKNSNPDWGKDRYPGGGRFMDNSKNYTTLADDFAKNPTGQYRYAVMASYMAMYSCLVGVVIGSAFFFHQNPFEGITLLIIIFSLAACPILFIFEYYIGLSPHVDTWAQFAVVYGAVSVPFYLNWMTSIVGILFSLTAMFKLLARLHNEKPPKPRKKKRKRCCSMTVKDCSTGLCVMARKAYWNLAGLYILSQIGIIVERLHYWIPTWHGDEGTLTGWFVIAKTAGTLLDMNGTLILLPMCRTMVRGLYNLSSRNSCASFFFANMFDLDNLLTLHIMMGIMILVAALAHTFGHYVNYLIVGWDVYQDYGIGIWINGMALLVVICLMYCSAPKRVRHGNFEQFMSFHHLFILFEILLLIHGKNFIGPNYWKWFIVPGFFYILERVLRYRRQSSPVGIVSVTHMENKNFKVLCLELEKTGPLAHFNEGQYVSITCPTISQKELHPFTISSAPQNETVTLHIRNMGKDSWTDRLQTYMKALAPMANMGKQDKNYYTISHLNGKGERVPKVNGPDGKPIIQVDGPHAAPTQHIAEYDRVMVIGSGIGVTPLRAALESVIHHRFKYAVGNAKPDHAYFYWIVSWKVVEGFCFMIRSIKEACDEWNDFTIKEPQNMYQKTFEMHVFVTSPPPPQAATRKAANTRATLAMPGRMNRKQSDDRHIWGPRLKKKGRQSRVNEVAKHPVEWNEWQLFEIMKDPPQGDETYQWGPLIIHGGRPKWEREFQYITDQNNRSANMANWNTGVLFCGNPIIAKDLGDNCTNFTKGGNRFKLHKENF